ncbi:MAG: two-component sensor histidine kinase [Dyadobacter sp. 50-39]|uniref:tetratricopeptide repeat-containing sensor histidine kinase n=1 Tax=Dyadobacter sp. 50-39 TaxID=1895756 RepID=UPI00095EC28A|nr:sensor histidine kinase [Dyadobacter sp. 50-39]OJV16429.1 MAG: two-component sensor histidine kinase [Dyadobacter sp. 50-39]
MKKILLLILLAFPGFSQTAQIDSLKQLLSQSIRRPDFASDTAHSQLIKATMKAYGNVNIDSSARYNAMLIDFCLKRKLEDELIYAYHYAGYLFQIKGDHHQSISFQYKALILAEKLKQFKRVAFSHGALAHAYTSLKSYKKALALCLQGLAVLSKHPDKETEMSILNVLGSVYREQGQLKEALKVNSQLYTLARAENDPWYESYGLHAVGRVFNDMGDETKAMDFYRKALTLSEKTGSTELQGNILLNTAHLYIKQRNWKEAYKYCMLAKQIAMPVKNSSIIMEAEEMLYTVFKETGRPDDALRAYESFVFLKDSLSREKNQHRIEALQAQYDNVQKTNALQSERVRRLAGEVKNQQLGRTANGLFMATLSIIVIAVMLFWNVRQLRIKNREIDRQKNLLEVAQAELADINKTLEGRVAQRTEELLTANRELTEKNEEIKKALFKGQKIERKRVAIELHDNLSSLLSAVNMSIQSIDPRRLSEPHQAIYQSLIHLIQNAYAEVRNISHNILPAELEKEGLAKTLETLIGRLNKNSGIQFSLSIQNLTNRLPIEIEFNLYSIVWELINNAIRHSQATEVLISLVRSEFGVSLSVGDNGIGLGNSSTKRGVGLQNIHNRLETLGGTFDIPETAGSGTLVLIEIPIEVVRFNGNLVIEGNEG